MPSTSVHLLDPLFRKLDSITRLGNEERQAIASLPAAVRTLRSNQDIARDGDRSSQCCVLLEGWACRYKLLDGGRRQIMSFHVDGDLPDLQGLHLNVMDHSLCTLTDAKVAFIPHAGIRDLIQQFPAIGAALWRDTLVDSAIFREWMVGMGRRSAYGRVSHLFCELYLKLLAVGLADNLRCDLPLTQAEWGDALGLSTVHINRTLQELRGQGLITLKGGDLIINDWNKLCSAAEFDSSYLHILPQAA